MRIFILSWITEERSREKFHSRLLLKKYLNLGPVKSPYILCTESFWIYIAGIEFFITKIFFKRTVNNFVYVFHRQLCLSLIILYCSESAFSCHNNLMLWMIKISNGLSNQIQYLYLQMGSLNKIKCSKQHFLYLKLILLLSRAKSHKSSAIRKPEIL